MNRLVAPASSRGTRVALAIALGEALVLTRTVRAPRALVRDAWTKPEYLARC